VIVLITHSVKKYQIEKKLQTYCGTETFWRIMYCTLPTSLWEHFL